VVRGDLSVSVTRCLTNVCLLLRHSTVVTPTQARSHQHTNHMYSSVAQLYRRYKSSCTHQPKYVKVLLRRAEGNERLEKYEQAIEDLNEIVTLPPSEATPQGTCISGRAHACSAAADSINLRIWHGSALSIEQFESHTMFFRPRCVGCHLAAVLKKAHTDIERLQKLHAEKVRTMRQACMLSTRFTPTCFAHCLSSMSSGRACVCCAQCATLRACGPRLLSMT
jgi:RNA polymerase I specific initiation factor